jgi:hypothetical protein
MIRPHETPIRKSEIWEHGELYIFPNSQITAFLSLREVDIHA